MLSSLRQDITYAMRSFRHAPGLVAAIVISIGLGIGANTTVFSLVNELLIRDMPVRDPHRLFTIVQGRSTTFSYPHYNDFKGATALYDLVLHAPLIPASVNAGGTPQRIWGQLVSGNYFDVLGVQPAMGRGISPFEDEVEGRNPVVVLAHSLWQKLGADPAIVGKTVRLNGTPYTVVGVNPPGFFGTDRGFAAEFWAPLAMRHQIWPDLKRDEENSRNMHWLEMTARLKPGVTREQAVSAMNTIATRVAAENKDKKARPVTLAPTGHFPDFGPMLAILMTALSVVVGLVLLIACANVANLLLARASTRRREMGLRLALGASRGRLIRQLLTESVLLSAAGAVLGFLLAVPGTSLLARLQLPIPLPIRFDFSPDIRVLLYTTGVAILTGLLFGFAPAVLGTRGTLNDALRSAGLGGTRRGWLGSVLVGVQVTLSLVLLVASGLFLRSLQNASSVNLGIRPEGVLMLALDTKAQGYTIEKTRQFFTNLERRVTALPGVQSLSYSHIAPLTFASASADYRVAGLRDAKPVQAYQFMVGSRYFETMGIPVVRGRDFAPRDSTGRVALVNKAMAAKLFGAEDPIGRRIVGTGEKDQPYEVIGITGDAKAASLGEEMKPAMFGYLPSDFEQAISLLGVTVVVKTAGRPAGMMRAVREQVSALDRDLAVFNVETLTEHVDKALMLPRVCAALFGLFGTIGLVLAAVGLYGVVNYSVRTRTREIGIRMALGARASEVSAMIARQGMLVVGIGVALGVAIALALSRYLGSLLYGVAPTDLVTFIAVPLILIAVALVAIVLPAHRAARLEPMSALRYE